MIGAWVAFMYRATVHPSVLFPVGICTREWFTDLIFAIRRRGIKTIVITHFVMVLLRGLRATVDFGIEEHVWGNFVALDEHIISDNGTGFP